MNDKHIAVYTVVDCYSENVIYVSCYNPYTTNTYVRARATT